VAAGVTGLAQVRGRRSLNRLDVLEADAEYARGPTLAGDIAILVRTVLVVLRREGSYGGEGENWRTYLARTETDGGRGNRECAGRRREAVDAHADPATRGWPRRSAGAASTERSWTSRRSARPSARGTCRRTSRIT
jgi:hypothetical protein